MTTEVIYICDVCGRQFDDEEECENHEFYHTFENVTAEDARIFNSNGEEMTWSDEPDDCFYYEVNTEAGYNAVTAFLNRSYYSNKGVNYGRFVWYEDEWVSENLFKDKVRELDNIFGA